MLSNQDWDQIIIGIGRSVVRYGYQLVVKWMDNRKTHAALNSSSVDTERLASHTRHRREPYVD